ncbi:MAG: filamentous hemagglutinin N-terminal domain-containing protein [Janthinobacterium lividum]
MPVRLAHACLVGALLASVPARAVTPYALPEGADVRHGRVAILRDDREMRIAQASDHAIIDWRTFDIGPDAFVHVLQPSTETALLNRVTGGTTSEIAGNLRASGHVYLVNPNGIRVLPSGMIGAASFVASTLDIANRDFLNDALRFGPDAQGATGTIVHDGQIDVDPGGFAALLGYRIEQQGLIHAPLSQVGLGAGTRMVLRPGHDDFLTVTQAPGVRTAGADGSAPPAIAMNGIVEAAGGQAHLEAPITFRPQTAPDRAIWIGGDLRAGQMGGRSGTIRVSGSGGIVHLSGLLDATGHQPDATRLRGGTVMVQGLRIVVERAGIDVSGAAGGGRVLLAAGPTAQPPGAAPACDGASEASIVIDHAASINANATRHGSGGDIHIVSDGPVLLSGRMQARGLAAASILSTSPGVTYRAGLPAFQPGISLRAGGMAASAALPPVHPAARPVAPLLAPEPASSASLPAAAAVENGREAAAAFPGHVLRTQGLPDPVAPVSVTLDPATLDRATLDPATLDRATTMAAPLDSVLATRASGAADGSAARSRLSLRRPSPIGTRRLGTNG